MSPSAINRRHFLRAAAGATALAAAAPIVAACSSDSDSPSERDTRSAGPTQTGGGSSGASLPPSESASISGATASGGAGSAIPAYVPFEKVKADLPGTADGVMPAFFHYPADPIRSVSGPVGSGGSVSCMATASDAPVAPEKSNAVWQEMNKQLGLEIKFTQVPGAEYLTKLNTTIAGGDYPDIVQLQNVAHLPDVLEKGFQDLTEFLAGDSVNDYPNLAAIPSNVWEGCLYNGKLYTLPSFRGAVGALLMFREDIFKEKSLPTTIKSGQDFQDICKELVDIKANKYAFSQSPVAVLTFIQEMLGAPNAWKEDGGKFTSAWEAPETKEALGIVTQMWKDKVFHPDAFAGTVNLQTLFTSGAAPMEYGSYAVWHFQLGQGAKIPGYSVNAFVPPKYDGSGQATKYLANPVTTFSAIKKAGVDRVREVLRVIDYWAAPFGTAEYLLLRFGVKDHDYTLQGSDPVAKPGASSDYLLPYTYVVSGVPALYEPGQQAVATAEYNIQKATVPDGVSNPAIGLFSDTNLSAGPAINKALAATLADIIQGRKSLSEFDSAIKTWKNGGGDKIASEYAQAYAKTH
jgi:putative aldouronate transport system substrate-binding protein